MQDLTGFDTFWKAYPRKIGKAMARKSWVRIEKESRDQLLGMLDVINKYYRFTERQYIPHASTFLNQRRWEDEEMIEEDTRAMTPEQALFSELRKEG